MKLYRLQEPPYSADSRMNVPERPPARRLVKAHGRQQWASSRRTMGTTRYPASASRWNWARFGHVPPHSRMSEHCTRPRIIVQAAGHTGIVNTPLAHHAFSCSAVRSPTTTGNGPPSSKRRALAGMAGGTHLVDLNQNRIAIAIQRQGLHHAATWPDVSPLRQYS